METKTPPELIQQAKSANAALNNIGQQFLAIETKFNSMISKFDHEKQELMTASVNALNFIQNQHKQQLATEQESLAAGAYIWNALHTMHERWRSKERTLAVAKWILVAIGLLICTGSILGGLLVAALGYFSVNAMQKNVAGSIESARLYSPGGKAAFSQQQIQSLKGISNDLSEEIEHENRIAKGNLESLRSRLAAEYAKAETKELEDRSTKLGHYENRRKETLEELRVQTTAGLQHINDTLNNAVNILNCLPETFDSAAVVWTNQNILKGKDIVAPYLRLGNEHIEIIIEGVRHVIDVPGCVKFLNKSNLAFDCDNETDMRKARAISHNIIARTLLALPASKTKITFIDPLELGGNAAPFTPLLREIYGGMVFTQQSDIDSQLSILTRAIENVIQKYLQDKFTDIADYNMKTKEVPEPYRLLVVYNFPHGFNDTSASKLLNIIKSGPKAGVHTILINDRNAKLPYGMSWESFEGINLKKVELYTPSNENYHFSFDDNLPYSEIVEYINKELPNVSSIKVPFTKYILPQNEWWREKAHKRYSVPIGRHALEVQNLKFDNEDDNQALLIGKPGSGKSNLLHVIIANSLWKYSPDQLEIYLIDFKGGVEFTIYADKKIPHIRTIAIESEREFGLSVLEGVENELLCRENDFSKAGVQNIEQYHERFPDVRMPRILLIVDEFQEFFTEDDNIKQAVDDKFDRIVRKGRAFGINTLFSSQTLSGNSIKKSTKELIDIRLALMCADLDANQILDDRNPAARDLTRPGEGIYNAENGKIEGNRRFQAFFIEKDDLTRTIESVVSFSKENDIDGHGKFRQIIFRGSEKAIMEKDNHPLRDISATTNPKSLRLWLGEPVAIANDVTAVIRKQGGSNLLIAGYDENIGLRLLCSSVVSIAAQQQPRSCKFYSFNFYNVDSEIAGIPDELFSNIDQNYINVSNRQVKEVLSEIKEEIDNRLSGNAVEKTNIYLCFFSLQRGRAFRKDGYMMSEEGILLAYILKEGPDMGIFSLVQVDTMDNFSKNLDDNLVKEFSQRIASQMNPENSVKIIGNQKAARLGANRAWYYDDNENTLVKFKPYELPNFSWVAQLQKVQSTLS